MGLEEVPVMIVGLANEEEDKGEGSWEESKFLGFSVKGYEGKILSLMNSICESGDKIKVKGAQVTTKFGRELKKLEWNVKEKSNRGGPRKRDKGISNGCL